VNIVCKMIRFNILPKKYWLLIFTLFYNAVMLYMICLHNSFIFDPWQLIWVPLFLIGGPVSVIISIYLLLKLSIQKRLKLQLIFPCVACILSVIIWSFGGIGSYFRPKFFQLVAKQNEQQVLKAIKNMKDPNKVYISGFRYPFCHMSTHGSYKNGALFLIVPNAPGPKDSIIYDPNNTVPKTDCEHLTGPWWYHYNKELR
jgi:hypothetical protein